MRLPNVAVLLSSAAALERGAFLDPSRPSLLSKGSYDPAGMMAHRVAGSEPVSATMWSVLALATQYFVIYTLLALVRTAEELAHLSDKHKRARQVLEQASRTVAYAPMLAVLFLGIRLRALHLSEGNPDEYGLPPIWVQWSMYACTLAVLLQTIIVLVAPMCGAEATVSGSGGGLPHVEGNRSLTMLRYTAMLIMYVGCVTVCVGAYTMEGAAAKKNLPVAPAVRCTINLCAQYFGIYLAISLVETGREFGYFKADALQAVLQLCTNTVNFAPMLCVLFIGARMRALQIDPHNGNPPEWAQSCFQVCAYSVLLQLTLLLMVPFMFHGTLRQGETDGDVAFVLERNRTMFMLLNAVRLIAMVMLYGGFTTVIYSVITMKTDVENNPLAGPTPPLSPAMQCVLNLTIQYFLVYLVLWVLVTVRQWSSGLGIQGMLNIAIPTAESARGTVTFAPMLSVLFLGVRLRVKQLQRQPPAWAQTGMQLSTTALLVQVILVLLLPVFTRSPAETDDDGNVVWKKEGGGVLAMSVVALRYCAFIALYGGVVAVIAGLFVL